MILTTGTKFDGTTTFNLLKTEGLNEVECREDVTQYRERWTEGGLEMSRCFWVKWSDTNDWVEDVLGWSKQNGTNIERYLPDKHPYIENCWAMSAELLRADGIQWMDATTGSPQVLQDTNGVFGGSSLFQSPGTQTAPATDGYAYFRLTYGMPLYEITADTDTTYEWERYVIIKRQYSTQNLTTVGGTFKYRTEAGGLDDSIHTELTVPQPRIQIQYKWLQVPALPTALDTCAGKMNELEFDGYEERKLLCLAPEIEPIRVSVGTLMYHITYIFLYNPEGWHKVYRPKKKNTDGSFFWEVVNESDNAKHIYEEFDFAELFDMPE